MDDRFELILEGTPVAKGRPRFSRMTGRVFTPGKTVKYERLLKDEAVLVMAGRAPMEGPLSVLVHAVFPIAKSWTKKDKAAAIAGTKVPTGKPDADNLLKALDAFNEVVWVDDGQVVDCMIRKRYGEKPCLKVVVARATLSS